MQRLIVRDETASATITWFNQPYLKDKFNIGEKYKIFGKVSKRSGKITFNSPTFDVEEQSKNTGRIIPIYPLTFSLSQNNIRKIMEAGIAEVYGKLPETLPDYLLKEYKLENINEATKQIHFPNEFKDFNIARNRLVFEELLSVQLALLELKNNYMTDKKGIEFSNEAKMSDVINSLPFKLTKAQLRVLEEIDRDMESSKNMNRLLQGDVGSGKTVVAMCAAYKAVKSGYQAAIMAPTAILATQHLENFKNIKVINEDVFNYNFSKKSDLIVCEMLDTALIDEEEVPVLNHVRNYLKEDGRIIPQGIINIIELAHLERDYIHYDEDVSCEILSKPVIYDEINFLNEINPNFEKVITLKAKKDSSVNGLKITTVTKLNDNLVCGPTPMLNPPLLIPLNEKNVKCNDLINVKLKYKLCKHLYML